MTPQDYADLVCDLNEMLEENKYFENNGICFSYQTSFYVDMILFDKTILWCSENDGHDDVKSEVLKKFKEYAFALVGTINY